MLDKTKALCAFLDASHSQYHARRYLTDILDSQGYTALREADEWKLTPGGKYYVTRGGSAVLAFRVPEGEALGFLISAAHTDRPAFKLKENGEIEGVCPRLAVERYGGQLCTVMLSDPEDAFETSFVAVPAQRDAGVTKSRGARITPSPNEKGAGVTLAPSDREKEADAKRDLIAKQRAARLALRKNIIKL